jgi:hypothetical protein
MSITAVQGGYWLQVTELPEGHDRGPATCPRIEALEAIFPEIYREDPILASQVQ